MASNDRQMYKSPFADDEQDMFLDLAQDEDRPMRRDVPRRIPQRETTSRSGLSESAYQAILDHVARDTRSESRLKASQDSDHTMRHRLSASSSYHTPRNGSPVDDDPVYGRSHPGFAPPVIPNELEDLQSRLTEVEMMEQSVSYADSTAPSHQRLASRTTTTAPTTVSSGAHFAPLSSDGVANKAGHRDDPVTNLREALARARTLLQPRVYRLLYAAVSDALALTELADSMSPKDAVASAYSIINGDADNDKELRQHTKSLCRGLTDLCVHLCEAEAAKGPTESSSLAMARSRTPYRLTRRNLDSSEATPMLLPSRSQARQSIARLNLASVRTGPSSMAAEPSSSSPRSPQDAKDYTAKYTLESRRYSRSRLGTTRIDDDLPEMSRSVSRAATDFHRTPGSRRYPVGPPILASEYLQHGRSGRSPSLQDILTARRTSNLILDSDLQSEVYTPSSRPLSSKSRRQTMEPRDFRKAAESSERDRKVSRLSMLGRYATLSEAGGYRDATPETLEAGARGPSRRPRPTTLLDASNYVSRVR